MHDAGHVVAVTHVDAVLMLTPVVYARAVPAIAAVPRS